MENWLNLRRTLNYYSMQPIDDGWTWILDQSRYRLVSNANSGINSKDLNAYCQRQQNGEGPDHPKI